MGPKAAASPSGRFWITIPEAMMLPVAVSGPLKPTDEEDRQGAETRGQPGDQAGGESE